VDEESADLGEARGRFMTEMIAGPRLAFKGQVREDAVLE
jgi:hypothetical protein